MSKATIVNIELPLDAKSASYLKLGDIVTVSGRIFTGRSRFHIRAVEENIIPPLDYSMVNGFLHAGPVMKKVEDGWNVVSIEPTSSIRFEKYGGDVIRKLNLRTVIGKTTMGSRTTRILKEVGGVYLSKIGICGNLLGRQVKKVHGVYFLDELGKTEATWIFEVDKFGPFFVAIDTHGNNYFQKLSDDVDKNMLAVKESLGISASDSLTDVNPQSQTCEKNKIVPPYGPGSTQ